jgi:hypothetical protein
MNKDIKNINSMSPSEQIAAIIESSYLFPIIKHPSLEVQLAAVTMCSWQIQFIKNPSHEVQLEAVKNNPNTIKYIDNPSHGVLLYLYFLLNERKNRNVICSRLSPEQVRKLKEIIFEKMKSLGLK